MPRLALTARLPPERKHPEDEPELLIPRNATGYRVLPLGDEYQSEELNAGSSGFHDNGFRPCLMDIRIGRISRSQPSRTSAIPRHGLDMRSYA